MRKKVFHVISELNIGGAEKQLLLMLPYLNQHFENHVVCLLGNGNIGKQMENKGIIVHYLQGKSRTDTSLIPKLHKLFSEHEPHLIIGYLIFADLLSRMVAKKVNIPYISSQRSSHISRPYLLIPDVLTAPLISGYTVQTEYRNNYFSRLPIARKKAKHIIPNAVARAVSQPKEEKAKVIITCIASLKKGKGHASLLHAAANIRLTNTNVEIRLAGDGSLRRHLKEVVKKLNMENEIRFLGLIPNTSEALQKADIFVLPTEGEGMSNALLEAMAHALPCITTDIPANREVIIHNKTGILIPPNNVEALTDAMHSLIENPALRTHLGHRARKHVETHHNPTVISEKWAAVISTHAK